MAVIFKYARRRAGEEYAVGNAGQSEFTLQELEYIPGISEVEVYINGVLAYPDIDYTLAGPRTIRLTEPLPGVAELLFRVR